MSAIQSNARLADPTKAVRIMFLHRVARLLGVQIKINGLPFGADTSVTTPEEPDTEHPIWAALP